jgi:zeta-carotene desaturase
MAAALRLAEAGFKVNLFEKRAVLGGRASSFLPPGESEPIDNCQHVLLGCCTNLMDFFQRTGAAQQFRFYDEFVFHNGRNASSLRASPLPAPFHLLPSLLRLRSLRWRDRRAIARAVMAIARTPRPYPDEPFAQWLDRNNQSTAAREHFWKVILVSALNEDLERLSTRAAFHVFVDAFLRSRSGYRMGVPTVPLSQLYSADAMNHKFPTHVCAPVSALRFEAARVVEAHLQNGQVFEADYYVSALPPEALVRLLGGTTSANLWAAVEWSPITGIHLWFDRPVMRGDHLTVTGRTIQWVFNKSSVPRQGEAGAQYVQVVISASRALLAMKREEVLDLVRRELGDVLPESRQAKLQRAVVVKETESTPTFPPGVDDQRPGPEALGFNNLFLAGDWTATGWPPTMEGAVRSGYRAAECVAAAAGHPQTFLVPDLKAGWLARMVVRS